MALADYRIRYLEHALEDRYQFQRLLGQGGFAAVYLVTHTHLKRIEALKVLLLDHRDEPDFARRFEQEARLASTLDHPNIVRVHDFGDVNGVFWYSMQYVEGTTLARIMERGPMPEHEAVNLLLPIVDALALCHSRGVVHRDVKPENVLLDTSGVPHLMDFGIAKSADDPNRTRTGLWVGTPEYVAPEQLAGEPIDGRADVYSVGVMLYEMVSGAPPFSNESVAKGLLARLSEDAPPLAVRAPGVEPKFAALVMRTLARDREQRPAGATELHDALAALVPAELLRAGPTARTTNAVRAEAATAERSRVERAPAQGTPRRVSRTVTGALASHQRGMRSIGVLGIVAGLVLAALSWLLSRESITHQALPTPTARAATPPLAQPETGPVPRDRDRGPTAPAVAELPRTESTPPPKRAREPLAAHAQPRGESSASPSRAEPPSPPPPDEPPARRPVRMPQPLVQTSPDISPELAARCGGGFTQVTLTIGTDGHVLRGRLLGREPSDCDRAALVAALGWTFAPATDATGQPIEATYAFAVPLPDKAQ